MSFPPGQTLLPHRPLPFKAVTSLGSRVAGDGTAAPFANSAEVTCVAGPPGSVGTGEGSAVRPSFPPAGSVPPLPCLEYSCDAGGARL